jgi:hypothetical protein
MLQNFSQAGIVCYFETKFKKEINLLNLVTCRAYPDNIVVFRQEFTCDLQGKISLLFKKESS